MRAKLLAPAAEAIKAGQLVAFPTETVYGLGADAFNPEAIRQIYQVKGRPQDNPLIVHLTKLEDLAKVAREVPELAYRLYQRFAPGPLSLILPKHPDLPSIVTAGGDTVAVRFPAHPLAQDLINLSGTPLVAPSANISGRPSPTTAAICYQDLQGKVPYILDGGPCTFGVESTVLDLTSAVPTILRPGGLTREALSAFCACPIAYVGDPQENPEGQDQPPVPKSPGMKYRHYAPQAKVQILTWQQAEDRSQVLANALQPYLDAIRQPLLADQTPRRQEPLMADQTPSRQEPLMADQTPSRQEPLMADQTLSRPGTQTANRKPTRLGFFLDQSASQALINQLATDIPYVEIRSWQDQLPSLPGPGILIYNYGQGALAAAHALFVSFRHFDDLACSQIFAQAEERDDVGLAYMERLTRAASGK